MAVHAEEARRLEKGAVAVTLTGLEIMVEALAISSTKGQGLERGATI